MDIYRFLAENDVSYQRADHSPVYTYQEAEDRVTPLPGVHTKNLFFLRDGKGRRHFLVVVEGAMRVDLKALRGMLGVDKLGMASAERLKKHLGVEPGAVTLLGVVNDRQRAVELVFDRAVWAADAMPPASQHLDLGYRASGCRATLRVHGAYVAGVGGADG